MKVVCYQRVYGIIWDCVQLIFHSVNNSFTKSTLICSKYILYFTTEYLTHTYPISTMEWHASTTLFPFPH